MRIFVTGATGLLGGNLVRLLHEKGGADLRVLVRDRSKALALEGIEVEKVVGDIRDRESIDRAVSGCEQVYHCAASVSQWRPNLEMMKEINIQGTVNVLEAALAAGVKRAVYVSTVDTLGLSTRDNPADETSEHESMAVFKNPYVDTKYEAEQRALEIHKRGLDLVIVKPTYMIGEWDVKPSSGQMIIQVARGRAMGYTTGGNNFVDVMDVCGGMILAMEKGSSGESYILANMEGNLTYKEMFTKIAGIVGAAPPRFAIPYPVALFFGYVLDVLGRAFRVEPDVNSITARMGFAPHYFTPRKAVEELGIPQSPIEGAISRAYQWFKKYGYL
jgi:dihydroflavonol-4-reductase